MSPWTIIGWTLIGIVCLRLGAFLFGGVAFWLHREIMHYRTRNTPPAPYQEWVQDGQSLWISDIFENGRIAIMTTHPKYRSGCYSSWGEDPDDWRQRVRNRRLWLRSEAP